MIRVALIVIGFLGITLTLILMQPAAPLLTSPNPDTRAIDDVTRTDTDFDAMINRPAPRPEVPAQTAASATAAQTASTGFQTQDALEAMIITALQQGQNDAYIDALVNDAAEKGTVDVPGALITADGRVDTKTLLKVLSTAPDAMRAGGTLYTVAAGDSLASIAYRFYGKTNRAEDIRQANLTILADTGLSIGLKLVIPPN